MNNLAKTERNTKMSKKMHSAYNALRTKDYAKAIESWLMWPALVAAVLALTGNVIVVTVAAALLAAVFVAAVVAFACDARMRVLGFSEYELERQGLA